MQGLTRAQLLQATAMASAGENILSINTVHDYDGTYLYATIDTDRRTYHIDKDGGSCA